jgi:quercetin dioxygenase-like cupin family protein
MAIHLLFAAAALAGAPAPGVGAHEPIVHVDLNSTALAASTPTHVVTSRTTFAPGAVTGWHFHPGQDFVYVVEGSLVMEAKGTAPVTLSAGQTYVTPAKLVHRASNPSKSAEAVAIAVSIVPDGQEASTPAQQ